MMFDGVVPRTITTATVAVNKATNVKNCQGRSVEASGEEGLLVAKGLGPILT